MEVLGWYEPNASGWHHDAGAKAANAWGLYDLHGNVFEWTLTAESALNRICRGGSWDNTAAGCTGGFRYWYPEDNHYAFVGFRLFLPASASVPHPAFDQEVSPSMAVSSVAFADCNGVAGPDAFEDDPLDADSIPEAFEDWDHNGTPDAFEDAPNDADTIPGGV